MHKIDSWFQFILIGSTLASFVARYVGHEFGEYIGVLLFGLGVWQLMSYGIRAFHMEYQAPSTKRHLNIYGFSILGFFLVWFLLTAIKLRFLDFFPFIIFCSMALACYFCYICILRWNKNI